MTILVCDCGDARACDFHAEELYAGEQGEDHREEQRAFEDASGDFYLPGWTPADQDARDRADAILADMAAEAAGDPALARALLTLYPDDAFTAADLYAIRKADAKGEL